MIFIVIPVSCAASSSLFDELHVYLLFMSVIFFLAGAGAGSAFLGRVVWVLVLALVLALDRRFLGACWRGCWRWCCCCWIGVLCGVLVLVPGKVNKPLAAAPLIDNESY